MCESLSLNINVTNLGPVDGDTVLQVYIRLLNSPLLTPLQSLASFSRISTSVGNMYQVNFILSPKTFAVVNGTMKEWILFPASLQIFVGEESPKGEEDWISENSILVELIGNVTRVVEW
jgi:beta-glucosidase